MKNPKLLIPVIIILAVGVFFLVKKSPSINTVSNSMPGEQAAGTEVSPSANSRYIPYSKSILESSRRARRVLFFYASWCPTCRPADANFRQNESKIPTDVTLIRVNYEDPDTDADEKALAKAYGVTYQHTYVQIDSTGKEIAKWNGGQIDELLAHLQ